MKSRSQLLRENARLWSLAVQLAGAVYHYRGPDSSHPVKSKALVRFRRFAKNRQ